MRLTRRTVSKGLAAAALAAGAGLGLPNLARARSPEDLARDLSRDLYRAFRDVEAGQVFTVPTFEISEPDPGAIGGTRVRAVVELVWAPGLRRHPFATEASSADAAYEVVLADAVAWLTPAFHPPRARP